MKTYEQYNELDPYGEEDWSDKEELKEGSYSIRMLRDYYIDLSYGYYDDEDEYIEKYTETIKLEVGNSLYIDLIDDVGDYYTVTIDTGDDYVGIGYLKKDCFEVID